MHRPDPKRVLAAAAFLLVTGCAQFAAQRTGIAPADDCRLPADNGITAACAQATVERAANFDLAYVEITDQGWLHFRRQLDKALELVAGSDPAERQVQVVLFVHGWKHGAAVGDEDVVNFRKVVLPAFAAAHPERRTVGLYVGWRGQSIAIPAIDNLSFYDRKATAEHVARGSIREVIGRLRALRDRPPSSSRAAPLHVTLIGHSFGGLIVFNSLAESLIDSLVRASGGPARPVVDLVVLLNPAFEASRFEPLFQVARHVAGPAGPDAPPIFVSITSEADLATRQAFPLGRSINSLFEHESWTDEDQCPTRARDGDCPDGDPSRKLEKMANTHTVGHMDRYLTHWLRMREDGGDTGSEATIECLPTGAGSSLALWTLRTTASVIAGHHDLYGPALWKFIVRMANGDARSLCFGEPAAGAAASR